MVDLFTFTVIKLVVTQVLELMKEVKEEEDEGGVEEEEVEEEEGSSDISGYHSDSGQNIYS